MRTTLDIDADILKAAKVLADVERKTLGQVLSELVRKGLAEAVGTPALAGELGRSRGTDDVSPAVEAGATRGEARREVSHANDARHRR